MNASHKIPDTFDAYVDRYVDGDDVYRQRLLAEHGAELREQHGRELLHQRVHPAPADMPPCPAWCTFEPGHGYDSSTDYDLDAGTITPAPVALQRADRGRVRRVPVAGRVPAGRGRHARRRRHPRGRGPRADHGG